MSRPASHSSCSCCISASLQAFLTLSTAQVSHLLLLTCQEAVVRVNTQASIR